ncbi:MAG: pyruvate, phosphate dikinase, partial [Candidatus Omnitrophica bacterium]|nr:pyruvate, phosphate dikinase [Candidatus Omnitrophota bacterium]
MRFSITGWAQRSIVWIVTAAFSATQGVPVAYAQECLRAPASHRDQVFLKQELPVSPVAARQAAEQLPLQEQRITHRIGRLADFFPDRQVPAGIVETLQAYCRALVHEGRLTSADVSLDGTTLVLTATYQGLPEDVTVHRLLVDTVTRVVAAQTPSNLPEGAPLSYRSYRAGPGAQWVRELTPELFRAMVTAAFAGDAKALQDLRDLRDGAPFTLAPHLADFPERALLHKLLEGAVIRAVPGRAHRYVEVSSIRADEPGRRWLMATEYRGNTPHAHALFARPAGESLEQAATRVVEVLSRTADDGEMAALIRSVSLTAPIPSANEPMVASVKRFNAANAVNPYPPLPGRPELREALRQTLSQEFGVELAISQVLVTSESAGAARQLLDLVADLTDVNRKPQEQRDLVWISPSLWSRYEGAAGVDTLAQRVELEARTGTALLAHRLQYELEDTWVLGTGRMPKALILSFDDLGQDAASLQSVLELAARQKMLVIFDATKPHPQTAELMQLLERSPPLRATVALLTDFAQRLGQPDLRIGSLVTFNTALASKFEVAVGASNAGKDNYVQAILNDALRAQLAQRQAEPGVTRSAIESMTDESVLNGTVAQLAPDPTLGITPLKTIEASLSAYGHLSVPAQEALQGLGLNPDNPKVLELARRAASQNRLSLTAKELEETFGPREGGWRDVTLLIKSWVGQPGFPLAEWVKQAAEEGAAQTPEQAEATRRALKDADRFYLEDSYGLMYEDEQVISDAEGSKVALQALVKAYTRLKNREPGNTGTVVIVPKPYYVGYDSSLALAGVPKRDIVYVDTQEERQFIATEDEIDAALAAAGRNTPDVAKILLVTSPDNPTSATVTSEEMQALWTYAVAHDVLMVLDGAYGRLLFGEDGAVGKPLKLNKIASSVAEASGKPVEEVLKHLAIVMTDSKEVIHPGTRRGKLASHDTELVRMTDSLIVQRSDRIANAVGLAVYRRGKEYAERTRRYYEAHSAMLAENKQLFEAAWKQMDLGMVRPGGAFYFFWDPSSLFGRPWRGETITPETFDRIFPYATGVQGVPGSAFGYPGWYRFSFAGPRAEIEETIQRVDRFVREVRAELELRLSEQVGAALHTILNAGGHDALAARFLQGGYGQAGYGVAEGAAVDGSHAFEGHQGYYTQDAAGLETGQAAFLQSVVAMADFFHRRESRIGKPIRVIVKLGIGGQHTPFQGIAEGVAAFQTTAAGEPVRMTGEYELGKDYEAALERVLADVGAGWDQLVVIPSSKSGSTDETMLIFSDILWTLMKRQAQALDLDGVRFAQVVFDTLHEVNVVDGQERKGGDLFRVDPARFQTSSLLDLVTQRAAAAGLPVTQEQVEQVFRRVLGAMFFETTDRPDQSRLSAFIRNSGLDRELGEDAPGFGAMFDNVGGRWTGDLHMMTFLAFHGLDAGAYWARRREGIRRVREGRHLGNELGTLVLDRGITDIAFVVPDALFWFGKSVEQNFNESIWQEGFANLIAIPASSWLAQRHHYLGQANHLIINLSSLPIAGDNVRVLPRLETGQDRQAAANGLADLFTTIYGMTYTVGNRLIARALAKAGHAADRVDPSDLDHPATRILQENLYLRQPYVELGKGLLEQQLKALQDQEVREPGAVQRAFQRALQAAHDRQLHTNLAELDAPGQVGSVEQLVQTIRKAMALADRQGRTFVPFIYLEGEKFEALRNRLIGMGYEWVLQGTGDQHISFQQVLAQPRKYLPLIISCVPEQPLPGRPAIGFAKSYLHQVSPHLVRDAFAEASYRALTELRESVGGAGLFLRLVDSDETLAWLDQAFASVQPLRIASATASQATALGQPTVRVDVEVGGGGRGHFVVPAGTSTGTDEAPTVEVAQAITNVSAIHAEVQRLGLAADQLVEIGQRIVQMGLGRVGANAALPYQMACAWAAARQRGMELYQFLRQVRPAIAASGAPTVRLQMNITNGGAHAENDLDLQEFMIVPHGATAKDAIQMGLTIDAELGNIYQREGLDATARGKEGGYAIPNLKGSGVHERVLGWLVEAIQNAGYTADRSGRPGTVSLALDVAATSMLVEGSPDRYRFEGQEVSAQFLMDRYADWVTRYPIESIEDGLGENDWEHWAELTQRLGQEILLIGDDLFVTQAGRLQEGIRRHVGNAVLIKLNQNGLLTTGYTDAGQGYLGTLEVIEMAKQAGYEVIISHRSGEAGPADQEVSIADVAFAVGAYAMKSGDPVQAERRVKWDRLAAIEQQERGREPGTPVSVIAARPVGTPAPDRQALEAITDSWYPQLIEVFFEELSEWHDSLQRMLRPEGEVAPEASALFQRVLDVLKARSLRETGGEERIDSWRVEVVGVATGTERYLPIGEPGQWQVFSRRLEHGEQGVEEPTLRIYVPAVLLRKAYDERQFDPALVQRIAHEIAQQMLGGVGQHWRVAAYEALAFKPAKPEEAFGEPLTPREADDFRNGDDDYRQHLAETDYESTIPEAERRRRQKEDRLAYDAAVARSPVLARAARRAQLAQLPSGAPELPEHGVGTMRVGEDPGGAPDTLVYFAGQGVVEGVSLIADPKARKALLGGKGAGMQEMMAMGIPVPPGFTITTQACLAFLKTGAYPPGLAQAVAEKLRQLEAATGKRFGDSANPLLVAVRSGAPVSMPGMMDTVLNLGLNDETMEGLAQATGNRHFALDSYRRFIEGYGSVVLGIDKEAFTEVLKPIKHQAGVVQDGDLDVSTLETQVLPRYQDLVQQKTGRALPTDVNEQLWSAIQAVFRSWNSDRAKVYRADARKSGEEIPEDMGTAVNVVAMVFGNMGSDSGTGVYFTRDSSTGDKVPYGEFSLNAQGEDIVSGRFKTQPIQALQEQMPALYTELLTIGDRLERANHDLMDIEFTIEQGTLYILQVRSGKRTGPAAVKIAVNLAEEGLITKADAIQRIRTDDIVQTLYPRVDPGANVIELARGAASSAGAVVGKVVFTPREAVEWAARGERVILVRNETAPEDVEGMYASVGILTARGGGTSHAMIVAKSKGIPAVVGADIDIDEHAGTFRAGELVVHRGQLITIDASGNRVLSGEAPLLPGGMTPELERLLGWADEVRSLGVRANADTPEEATAARRFGAGGIGLVRTEHMFFGDRLPMMRQMILAKDAATRQAALDALQVFQQDDFEGIFRAMAGLPVTVRLLDPPLHEFLPDHRALALEIQRLELSGGDPHLLEEKQQLLAVVDALREMNPMLGLRGSRLGIVYPEITRMQARAIMRAAVKLAKEGVSVRPEIMVPLVFSTEEFNNQQQIIEAVAQEVLADAGLSRGQVPYTIGTMIELPGGALDADRIARSAAFFSFGTNDLTQTTLGISRDDAQKGFLQRYQQAGLLGYDPFVTLHPKVAELMEVAITKGRATQPALKIGICGEHGRDPASIVISHQLGLDYVSPSSYGVLIARLVAAQAELDYPRRPTLPKHGVG